MSLPRKRISVPLSIPFSIVAPAPRRLPQALRLAGLALGLALLPGAALAVPDKDGGETAPPPPVSASSAILMDAVTGTVVWQKNAYVRRPMASTTKIMTAALMIERNRLRDMVTISGHAARTPYANLHATAGEQIGMVDLLHAVLMRSANDGCVAAAEHLAGSEAAFVGWMNQRAQELGARDTHFVTTNGLHDAQHFSTAFDMARITRHAIRYPLFNQVVGTTQYRMSTRTVNTGDTLIENHNKFLGRYAGADGVKTGYVRQSGKCLVSSATRLEGNYPWRLLAVVLNSRDTYADCAALLDYGFKNFQPVFFARAGQQVGMASVVGGVTGRVPVRPAEDLFTVVPRGPVGQMSYRVSLKRGARAPIRRAQVMGSLLGYLDGKLVSTTDLLSARPVRVSWTVPASRWGSGMLLLLLLLTLGPRYARALTEGTRRRRRRLAPRRRNTHLGWASECEWAARTGTGN